MSTDVAVPSRMSIAEALRHVCELLSSGDSASAARVLSTAFPPPPASTRRSPWPLARQTKVFIRDGFTDRYFGVPLVFPGALRALSVLLPSLFPYHPNWKQSVTHPAYWSHFPTIDHVVPVARGGADDEANVVTTSMLGNAAKSNWLLCELGWPTTRAPLAANWDGLLAWFCAEYERNEKLSHEPSLRKWYKAATSAGQPVVAADVLRLAPPPSARGRTSTLSSSYPGTHQRTRRDASSAPAEATDNDQKSPPTAPQDADLAAIIEAWDRPSEAIRAGIVAMVNAASGK